MIRERPTDSLHLIKALQNKSISSRRAHEELFELHVLVTLSLCDICFAFSSDLVSPIVEAASSELVVNVLFACLSHSQEAHQAGLHHERGVEEHVWISGAALQPARHGNATRHSYAAVPGPI